CNRQYRLAVELRVVEAVQKMDAARPRSGQAAAELAGVLRVAAGHKRRRLFVPHLNETYFVLLLAQRFHDAVDAVARDAEDHFHAPVANGVDEYVRRCGCHTCSPFKFQSWLMRRPLKSRRR